MSDAAAATGFQLRISRISWRVVLLWRALMAALKGRNIPAQGNALWNRPKND
jgi:hypothetical protein